MTRTSIHEYVAAQRPRYLQATRGDKRRILDEVVAVTGYHRKAALRRLHRPPRSTPREARTGRPRVYGPDVAAAAQVLWEASGEIGAVRLQPFVPELLDRLLACGALRLRPDTAAALRRLSAATLKRLLAPARAARPPRGGGITRAGTWLKHQIPIRTFAEWDDARPGFLEGDLVAHCGASTLGFYLCTLCAVDIVTSWTELEAVWGKGQVRVGGAIHHVRQRLPMPLLGWDSDSGSEFINESFWRYCQRERITFTRGRAYRKNDSAHVEQKNGAVVRRWVGYTSGGDRARGPLRPTTREDHGYRLPGPDRLPHREGRPDDDQLLVLPRDPGPGRAVDRAHLATFLAHAAGGDGTPGLPGFVKREFEAYLQCGLLGHG